MPLKDLQKRREYQTKYAREIYSKTEKAKQCQKRYHSKPEVKERIKNNQSKEKRRLYRRDYERRIRQRLINLLGGKCKKCGFSDKRALQVDHINAGGSQERKQRNYVGNFHNHVRNSILNNENKYQLLCANCNWIKRFENNE